MRYLIAGGGTGGHVFMGVAVADALKKIEPDAEIVFVGTNQGLERTAVPKAGYGLELIQISGIKGKTRLGQFRALFRLPIAVWQSIKILRKHRPVAILGVGGYASAPALMAAFLLRIPFALIEPNSVPGLVNKVLGRFSRAVFTTFKRAGQYFPKKTVKLVGNPIRSDGLAPIKELPCGEVFNILVLGGSQGAKALNEKLPECFLELKRHGVKIGVVHQSGKADHERTSKSYLDLGLQAQVLPFIDNMASAYAKADLIICRAGAATCAEVLSLGPPAIFIPLPNAIYDHQMLNARELLEEGAALLIPQDQITPVGIAKMVQDLISNPDRYQAMNARARQLAKPKAAAELAQFFINRF